MKLSFPPSIHVSGRWVHGWQKASRCKHHARAHLLFLVQPECDPHVNKILPKHFSPHNVYILCIYITVHPMDHACPLLLIRTHLEKNQEKRFNWLR
jgi:hypothetical protein